MTRRKIFNGDQFDRKLRRNKKAKGYGRHSKNGKHGKRHGRHGRHGRRGGHHGHHGHHAGHHGGHHGHHGGGGHHHSAHHGGGGHHHAAHHGGGGGGHHHHGRRHRFAQVGMESESEMQTELTAEENDAYLQAIVDQVLSMNKQGGGAVNKQGKLCPGCQTIDYNVDSPLSANDKKLLRLAYNDLHVPSNAPVVAQDSLENAILMVDDATKSRKSMLDQYPPANSVYLETESEIEGETETEAEAQANLESDSEGPAPTSLDAESEAQVDAQVKAILDAEDKQGKQ